MSVKEMAALAAEAVITVTDFKKNPDVRTAWVKFISLGLGSLRWRRILSEDSIAVLYEVIREHDGDDSQDETKLEWISSAMMAFFMNLGKDYDDLANEVAHVIGLSNCLSIDEQAAELDLDVQVVYKTLKTYPVALFCFLLYHSGLQYSL